ncbi:MAG: energy transducer TonB [Bacteroidetes bacterium]|nr:energy transducer TonB [Bacteroidota bacterium]
MNFLDVLFETRNKSYGAYDLRVTYSKRIKRGAMIMFLFLFVVVGGYLISKFVNPADFLPKKERVVDITELQAPPPMDETAPPPPPPPPPPPVQSTIKFVPPVIKEDELVQNEEVIQKQDDLQEVKVAAETVKGDDDAEEVINTDLGDKGAVEAPSNEVFTFVEQMPEFPGGEEAMYKFIQNNIKYPPFALENDITGKVYMEFVIDENGEVNDVKCIRDIGGGCGKEADRVIKQLPKWKPGKQNGRAVKVRFSIPVVFETN